MFKTVQTKEFDEWFMSLTTTKAKAIFKKILIVERLGNLATVKQGSKSLGKGLYELRDMQYGLRAYYAFHDGELVILLNGGDKNTKKQQNLDIKKARKILEEIKREEREI